MSAVRSVGAEFDSPHHERAALRWALVGLAIHVVVVGGLLLTNDGRPEYFVHFGRESVMTEVARDAIDDDLLVPHRDGHDGQAFWVVARDPLVTDPTETGRLLEGRPAYRAQRILYPLLAAPWRLAGETALLWGLIVTNLAAVAVGGYVAAVLARDLGLRERAGVLVLALNPGVLLATFLDTSETVAVTGVLAAILLVRRGHIGWAVAAGAAAVLGREASWLALAGLGAFAPGLKARQRLALAVGPAVAGVAWGLYIRARFGWPAGEVRELGLPLGGYVEAWQKVWEPLGYWADAAGAALPLLIGLYVIWRWRQERTALLAAALPLGVLSFVVTAPVVVLLTNSLRVATPLFTLALLDLQAITGARATAPSPTPGRPPA